MSFVRSLKKRALFTVLFAIVINFAGFGQILEPVKWEFDSKDLGNGEFELIFSAEIEKKWHLYSQDIPMSPPATVFTFEKDSLNYALIGKVTETESIEEYDPNFEMTLRYFADKAVFKQKVKLLSDKAVTIKGFLEFMCCDDTKCLPPSEVEFEFPLKSTSAKASTGILQPVVWTKEVKKVNKDVFDLIFSAKIDEGYHLYTKEKLEGGPLPTEFKFTDNTAFTLIDELKEPIKAHTEFDDVFEMNISYWDNEAKFIQRVKIEDDETFNIVGEISYMVCNDVGCVALWEDFELGFSEGNPSEIIESSDVENSAIEGDITGKSQDSLLFFFIIAFLGGLAAIVTPCVFPMIPMTVSFFMNDKDSKKKALGQASMFGFAIIFIYVLIGSVLGLLFGADFANFVSTHWAPNILFFLVFVIFAASFFGMFEITMPSWLITKSDKQADKGGIMGPVFMALTLVLVSFSCTGPIIGWILVEAASGIALKPIIGMLGFSLAFALPFTLFAFFPSWLSNLPKSGGWLNSVKVVLGFLELAFGLKFLSMADQTYHWGILDVEVYLAIWIVIFTLMGFYLLGKIKFAHDSDVKHVSVPRLILAIITFSFVIYMIPGMFGAPLKGLQGYIPPRSSHDFDINKIIRDNIKTIEVSEFSGSNSDNELCESPKYSDFLHLPHGLDGYFDYDQALACAKAQNKPLFVDFTGHACVNCREMEANVWSDPAVLKRLERDYIVVALYVDDKADLPKSEWYKSEFDGKMKRSIGKKNADIQASRFGVNSQPYYVLLDHEGELLVTPRAYDLDIEEFVEFLDKGLESFKKR